MPDAPPGSDPSERHSTAHRWITAGFGALFVVAGVAIAIVAADDNRLAAYLLALLVGGLGVDAIGSAVGGRRSLLSRIGPLP